MYVFGFVLLLAENYVVNMTILTCFGAGRRALVPPIFFSSQIHLAGLYLGGIERLSNGM